MRNYTDDDVTVSSRAYIPEDSIKPIRVSNGLKYGQCKELTICGEEHIYEL